MKKKRKTTTTKITILKKNRKQITVLIKGNTNITFIQDLQHFFLVIFVVCIPNFSHYEKVK